MKRVYFVRHGETTYNVERLVQDGSPLLTDRGQRQALQVAQRVNNLDFTNLVVSDYERTKQTAAPLVEATKHAPVYTPLFREIRRPSEFFHTPRASEPVQEFMDKNFASFVTDPDWHHSDEESFNDSLARAHEALAYLESLDGDTVVISHGHFIRLLVALVATSRKLDGATWQNMNGSFFSTNTGITTLTYNEENKDWQILTFNDHAHFAE